MRKLFIAGNWKMNLSGRKSCELVRKLGKQVGGVEEVKMAVCPPFVYLKDVAKILSDTSVAVGAQNMYPDPEGAFTGEVAGSMLLDVGCRYVILGHSERRHIMNETDEFINAKVHKALELGLEPIICVGEKLEQREAGETKDLVAAQVEGALANVAEARMDTVTIAYEPVWAIGTGKTATPEQADEVHGVIRDLIADMYSRSVADDLVIQYGGSVKPHNAEELLKKENIDGALVGGASLKAETFVPIIQTAVSVAGD